MEPSATDPEKKPKPVVCEQPLAGTPLPSSGKAQRMINPISVRPKLYRPQNYESLNRAIDGLDLSLPGSSKAFDSRNQRSDQSSSSVPSYPAVQRMSIRRACLTTAKPKGYQGPGTNLQRKFHNQNPASAFPLVQEDYRYADPEMEPEFGDLCSARARNSASTLHYSDLTDAGTQSSIVTTSVETGAVDNKETLIENYTTISEVGRGGFAKAVLVSHSDTGAVGVAKVPKHWENSSHSTYREIMALANLVHPNVIRLLDVATNGIHNIIITEYCSGGSLDTLIDSQMKSPGPDWGEQVVSYFKQLKSAVTFMHGNNYVHLDIKAENVVLDEERERVKLIDFGLATKCNKVYRRRLYKQCGTLGYMAPEVLDKSWYPYSGGKADIWSLGCLLYELCTLRVPYYESWVDDLRFRDQKNYYLMRCRSGRPAVDMFSNTFSDMQQLSLKTVIWRMLDPEPSTRADIVLVNESSRLLDVSALTFGAESDKMPPVV